MNQKARQQNSTFNRYLIESKQHIVKESSTHFIFSSCQSEQACQIGKNMQIRRPLMCIVWCPLDPRDSANLASQFSSLYRLESSSSKGFCKFYKPIQLATYWSSISKGKCQFGGHILSRQNILGQACQPMFQWFIKDASNFVMRDPQFFSKEKIHQNQYQTVPKTPTLSHVELSMDLKFKF